MLSSSDFRKKQIIVVFFSQGEKLSFLNDNVIVKDKNNKIKLQCTCYRVFLIYAIGHFSITSAVMEKAKHFGFFIALMTPSFRIYSVIGSGKDGNTMLKRLQYSYDSLDLAKHIIKNKILVQQDALEKRRCKSDECKLCIESLINYGNEVAESRTLANLMAYEGLASKEYFGIQFDNINWNGRQPRIKRDVPNSLLDIGYTVLFAFIEALLEAYGFDVYCGVLHTQFYMRKSLVCDIVEPFRPIVDYTMRKAYNLKQVKDEDFICLNHQYKLKWEKSPKYVALFLSAILESKDDIFWYVQSYYRCFMKGCRANEFPVYRYNDIDKL